MSTAAIMAGLSITSSLLDSSKKDKRWKSEARDAGRSRAQVEAARSRAMAELPEEAFTVAQEALALEVNNQMETNKAISAATVAAAAAGAAGANVTQTTQEVEATSARQALSIRRKKEAGMLAIEQKAEDILTSAEDQIYSVHASGGQSAFNTLATAALAGFGSYVKYR